MKIHSFASTTQAYDACQTGLPSDEVIAILPEGVVGISGTWPVAVTKEHGCLHAKRATLSWAETTYPPQVIELAVSVADLLDLPVDHDPPAQPELSRDVRRALTLARRELERLTFRDQGIESALLAVQRVLPRN